MPAACCGCAIAGEGACASPAQRLSGICCPISGMPCSKSSPWTLPGRETVLSKGCKLDEERLKLALARSCWSTEGGRLGSLLVTRRMDEPVSCGGSLCTSSAGRARPIPAAAACVESVLVTVWICLFAVDCGTEALGWCMGRSAETFFVCSPDTPWASAGS
jgi:hypothetical protein